MGEAPTLGTSSESSLDRIIELYKRDVDRTLLREQLRKTPDERVRELVEMERFAESLHEAAKRSAG
jgi:hypothetical protein